MSELLSTDIIVTAVAMGENVIITGLTNGLVYVFSVSTSNVKCYHAHQKSVNGISIDSIGNYFVRFVLTLVKVLCIFLSSWYLVAPMMVQYIFNVCVQKKTKEQLFNLTND